MGSRRRRAARVEATTTGPRKKAAPRGDARIRCKHVRDAPEASDGTRFLVDRLWPRGVRKADLEVPAWLREVAPSDALRRWFGHDPARWEEFQRRYFAELDQHPEDLEPLLEAARRGPVTLVFGTREREHNNAVALANYLRRRLRAKGSAKERAARPRRAVR